MLKTLLISTFTITLSFSVWANDAFFQGAEALNKGDVKSAISLFKKAYSEGHSIAPYTIGVLYEKGEGVKQDFYQAKIWYTKAADKGHEGAKSRLPFVGTQIAALEGGN
jgi:TPR repeat protein